MSNQTTSIATNAPEKLRFSQFMDAPSTQSFLMQTLGNEQSVQRFGAGIVSAVSVNPALQECVHSTVLAGALLGEALKLSPSPQLGHYYLVPFKQKEKKDANGKTIAACTNAVFVLGWKGYVQLALRSGQYRDINVVEIHEGQIKFHDYLRDQIVLNVDATGSDFENKPVVGYYAIFELLNGFTKGMYWTKEKMMNHADRYSAAFSARSYKDLLSGKIPKEEAWKYSSFWYKEFDDMAKKTMIRQLISKWGIMSIEMQSAFEQDDSQSNLVNGKIVTEVRDQIEGMDIAGALSETTEPAAEQKVINLDEV